MRVLIQRVTQSRVLVAAEVIASIDRGLLLLLAVEKGDTEATLDRMVHKVAHLRIFPDDEGKMNRSVLDIQGQALVVSQFTLAGELNKGFRPSFARAEWPERAQVLYERFCERLAVTLQPDSSSANRVARGRFGANMQVHLVNDGPVTIWLDMPPA